MGGLAALAVIVYGGLAALELPGLWGREDRRGELWSVLALLTLGLAYALAVLLGFGPPSPWPVVQAIFKPLGTILFKLEE